MTPLALLWVNWSQLWFSVSLCIQILVVVCLCDLSSLRGPRKDIDFQFVHFFFFLIVRTGMTASKSCILELKPEVLTMFLNFIYFFSFFSLKWDRKAGAAAGIGSNTLSPPGIQFQNCELFKPLELDQGLFVKKKKINKAVIISQCLLFPSSSQDHEGIFLISSIWGTNGVSGCKDLV